MVLEQRLDQTTSLSNMNFLLVRGSIIILNGLKGSTDVTLQAHNQCIVTLSQIAYRSEKSDLRIRIR